MESVSLHWWCVHKRNPISISHIFSTFLRTGDAKVTTDRVQLVLPTGGDKLFGSGYPREPGEGGARVYPEPKRGTFSEESIIYLTDV